MSNRFKLLLVAMIATTSLWVAIGSASARRLESSNGSIQVVWSPLQFGAPEIGQSISCPVTIAGSFHSRTISKVSGALVGYVNRATVNSAGCSEGSSRVLVETLPWHIRYNSFSGTLPSITGITFTLVGIRFSHTNNEGTSCLIGTTAASPGWARSNLSAGRITGLQVLEEHTIPLGGAFICSFVGNAEISGTGTLTAGESGSSITIRLVQ
jgi:hypothetical protein